MVELSDFERRLAIVFSGHFLDFSDIHSPQSFDIWLTRPRGDRRMREEARASASASKADRMKEGTRIAFLLASIHSGSATKVWPELVKESERRKCLFFIFPGGRLSSRDEFEYMRNSIFGLVKPASFDAALCWASSLSGFAAESEVEEYLESNLAIPLVTFGLKIGRNPVVNIDAYSGMKQLVLHLVKRHGCEKIAFLGGPRAHSSAEDRFKAYRDTLKEMGIPCDEGLVVLDNPWTEGRRAVLRILDERKLTPGKDFDALCSASDLLSFEAAALLRERGWKIPQDVALAGFNDSEESNLLSPTFTTVRMPLDRQAHQAFHMLLELLEGKKPGDRTLKTSLVLRQSCGCRTPAVQKAGAKVLPPNDREARRGAKPVLEELLKQAARYSCFSSDEREKLLRPIVSSFLESAESGSEERFLESLDQTLDEFIVKGRDIDCVQNVISALRKAVIPRAASMRRATALEGVLGKGRVLIAEAEKRVSTYKAWKEKRLDHWLSILSHQLLCAKDVESIVEIAARCLPPLGINAAFLVLESDNASKRLFAGGFCQNQQYPGKQGVSDNQGHRQFGKDRLLPEAVFPKGAGSYIVLPLYFESTSLGYVVLKADRSDAYVYEEVRAQLSSALRGVLLFEKADEARTRAEKAERMKSEFLAGITGELQEPIRFIRERSIELLSRSEGRAKEELEAIVAASARQMDMTRELLELSLAQVEDFPLRSGLFDPKRFLEGLAAGLGAGHDQGGRSPRRIGLSFPQGSDLPMAWGDEARVAQVIKIFLEYLFHTFRLEETVLEASMRESGPRLAVVAQRVECEKTADAVARLRSYIETDSAAGLPAGKTSISIELAKRIALLHGATLGLSDSGGRLCLYIDLPFPSVDAFRRIDPESRDSWSIGLLSSREPLLLQGLYGERKRIRIGLSEALDAKRLLSDVCLLYIDPQAMSGEELSAAQLLIEDGRFRRLPCIIPADLEKSPFFEGRLSLGEILGRYMPERDSPSLLAIGQEIELEQLERSLAECGVQGFRVLPCRRPDELPVIAGREKPRLILLCSQDPCFLQAVLDMGTLNASPLLWLFEKTEGFKIPASFFERPRTLVCNSGQGFFDIAAELAKNILGEKKPLLPAPTGAIVIKALFYLNRHFKEKISRWRLSEELNASEDYLSRIFRYQMGITLWDYLNRLRIAYAVELLVESSDTVAEVAAKAGFQDQAYFCRVFRKLRGTTPGALRKESRHDVRKVQ